MKVTFRAKCRSAARPSAPEPQQACSTRSADCRPSSGEEGARVLCRAGHRREAPLILAAQALLKVRGHQKAVAQGPEGNVGEDLDFVGRVAVCRGNNIVASLGSRSSSLSNL
mmetsp:Transcript_76292/g.236257  ORF Transcript_76292/g.236257 Transcript_76292/m.236257 type:complete len:112 (-) Transcript_76292:162-497(-)